MTLRLVSRQAPAFWQGGKNYDHMGYPEKDTAAWPSIRNRDAEGKNDLLRGMADSLMACTPAILAENCRDMEEARGTISDVMLDRLYLDEKRLAGMAEGIRALTALPDHTGRILSQITRPNGMTICKQQVPMGLIAIIYESRPNVTSDAAALAVKSGNVCVLRSGRRPTAPPRPSCRL